MFSDFFLAASDPCNLGTITQCTLTFGLGTGIDNSGAITMLNGTMRVTPTLPTVLGTGKYMIGCDLVQQCPLSFPACSTYYGFFQTQWDAITITIKPFGYSFDVNQSSGTPDQVTASTSLLTSPFINTINGKQPLIGTLMASCKVYDEPCIIEITDVSADATVYPRIFTDIQLTFKTH